MVWKAERYCHDLLSWSHNDLINNSSNMAKKEFSFDDAVTEIEDILRNLENGELDIDKLSVEVKRASELIKQCQKKLKSTEDEINSIFKEML